MRTRCGCTRTRGTRSASFLWVVGARWMLHRSGTSTRVRGVCDARGVFPQLLAMQAALHAFVRVPGYMPSYPYRAASSVGGVSVAGVRWIRRRGTSTRVCRVRTSMSGASSARGHRACSPCLRSGTEMRGCPLQSVLPRWLGADACSGCEPLEWVHKYKMVPVTRHPFASQGC